jgi:predicted metal-dependent hydrolase
MKKLPSPRPRRDGPLSKLRQLAREAADAALQMTLPLFDHAPAIARPPPGRRVLRLAGRVIEFELRRSRRRTIGFVVDDRGLTVTAPRWVPVAEIDAALREKSDWVERKMIEWREHADRRDRLAIRWADGESLPFLGATLQMRRDDTASVPARQQGNRLLLALPPDAGAEQYKKLVQGWLQSEARKLFAERIEHFAQRLGRRPTSWRLSSARTQWGSCGPDGAVRLNWRLMHFPPEIIDYVVAHEMAHLRELNHSPRFWSTVEKLFPNHQSARAWLRSYPDDLTLS